MERAILGLSLQDRVLYVKIHRKPRVRDPVKTITSIKWSWTGLIARLIEWRASQ